MHPAIRDNCSMFEHLLIYTLKVYIANNMELYGTKSDCFLIIPKGRHTEHPRFATKAMKSQIREAVQAGMCLRLSKLRNRRDKHFTV